MDLCDSGLFSCQHVWIDFWQDLVYYLTQRSVFHLSCVSHSLNKFAWANLIPICGVEFGNNRDPERAQEYMNMLPKLKSLKFHTRQIPEAWLDTVASLTNLEVLHTVYIDPSDLLSSFTKLKECEIWVSELENSLLTRLGLMKHLTQLNIGEVAPENVQSLSCLTNLYHLDLYWQLHNPEELDIPEALTKLTFLRTAHAKPPRNLNAFTNLKVLKLSICQVPTTPLVLPALTRLEELQVMELDEADGIVCSIDFSLLTNLKSLAADARNMNLPTLETISLLPKMERLVFCDHCPTDICETQFLQRMTNLTYMDVCATNFEFVQTLTNLTHLAPNIYRSFESGMFRPLSNLTNLRVLDATSWPYGIVVSSEDAGHLRTLTNLKTLHLRKGVDRTLQDITFLTSLEELNFSNAKGLSPNGILTISKFLTQLRRLNIEEPRISRKDPSPQKFGLDTLRPLLGLQFLDWVKLRGWLADGDPHWSDVYPKLTAQETQ